MTTSLDLDEIQKACDEATSDGPWGSDTTLGPAKRSFLEMSRTAVPALVKRVRELEEEIKALESGLISASDERNEYATRLASAAVSVAAEREACAKIVEEAEAAFYGEWTTMDLRKWLAASIRARGDK